MTNSNDLVKISPSLLAADMGDLRNQLAIVEKAGVPYIHMDIMDGCFVPNISYGSSIIKALRKDSNLVFDVHLMVEEPDRYLEDFRKAGADILCVHVEACKHIHRTLQYIKSLGAKAAVALNPGTPLCAVEELLADVDMVLLMSVNPGFGGQSFIEGTLDKITRLRQIIDEKGLNVDIEVDGGIKQTNVEKVVQAGANVIVAGTAIFGKEDIAMAAKEMIELANK